MTQSNADLLIATQAAQFPALLAVAIKQVEETGRYKIANLSTAYPLLPRKMIRVFLLLPDSVAALSAASQRWQKTVANQRLETELNRRAKLTASHRHVWEQRKAGEMPLPKGWEMSPDGVPVWTSRDGRGGIMQPPGADSSAMLNPSSPKKESL